MSTRSRSQPWWRPPRAVIRLRYWHLCGEWQKSVGNEFLWRATRTATTGDIPEVEVVRFMGEKSSPSAAIP